MTTRRSVALSLLVLTAFTTPATADDDVQRLIAALLGDTAIVDER